MSEPTIIVGVAKTATGYVVYDQLQREHHAADMRTLGVILAGLLEDDEIPVPEKVTTNAAKLRAHAVKTAASLVPAHAELAEPVIDGLTALLKFVHQKIKEPRPPKAAKTRGPSPGRRASPQKVTVRQVDR